jgi:hypothetical protein
VMEGIFVAFKFSEYVRVTKRCGGKPSAASYPNCLRV